MSLRKLEEGVWVVESERDPSGLLPVRSALLAVEGGWVVFSPIPGFDQHASAVRELGPIRALVAPNLMHHLGLADAIPAFPDVPAFGRPSLQGKRPDLRWSGTLGETADALWAGSIDQVVVGGMPKLDEVVFFHRPTRTLVLSDLAFNVLREDRWGVRLFMRLNGALGHFGPSRICRLLMSDRERVREAVDRMIAWDPKRLLVSHGEIIEVGGRAELATAFAFLAPDERDNRVGGRGEPSTRV